MSLETQEAPEVAKVFVQDMAAVARPMAHRARVNPEKLCSMIKVRRADFSFFYPLHMNPFFVYDIVIYRLWNGVVQKKDPFGYRTWSQR
jgi:hypothetical protein